MVGGAGYMSWVAMCLPVPAVEHGKELKQDCDLGFVDSREDRALEFTDSLKERSASRSVESAGLCPAPRQF